MNILYSTTQFIGLMEYQRISNKKLYNASHKKARWFGKPTTRLHTGEYK